MSAGVSITIGKAPVDLSDVSWYAVAPCGCTSGVILAHIPGDPEVIATAGAAERRFWDSPAEAEKYRRLGYRMEPDLRARVTDRLRPECPHEPRFGYSIPTPDGMTWAVGGYHGERTRVLHLVTEAAAADREGLGGYTDATSLCGVDKPHWSRAYHLTDGKVECSRCLRKVTP